MPERPRLLIISFSPIHSDARVLKQVRLFADTYDVTTCGFGPSPDPGVEHIEVAPPVQSRSSRRARVRSLAVESLKALHQYRGAFWAAPHARSARRALRGRHFDAVITNDIDTLLVGTSVVPLDRLHADLHEYWLKEGASVRGYRRFAAGYYRWLCGRIAGQAASSTTVGNEIALAYQRECGFTPAVVPNVAPYHDLEPTPPRTPLRLVHAGVGAPSRGIHKLVAATMDTKKDVTLDLYLMPANVQYMAELRDAAERSGGRVTVHDPVPQSALVETLNGYDIGAYLLEPQTVNSRFALPNKIFDFIQARLGLIVGPSPEMAAVVRRTGVGVVTDGYAAEDLTRVLDGVTADTVVGWKAASSVAAHELSAENVQHVWADAVTAIVRSSS